MAARDPLVGILMTSTRLLLIRHAESAPDPDLPEPEWPLSETGESQAFDLVEDLSAHRITTIYSSPYLRAVDTVTPLAHALGLPIVLENDLRERKLTNSMHDDWRQALVRSWDDFDFALQGCESSRTCQSRVDACVTRLAEVHGDEVIALASHGNAIALFLHSIDANFGYDQWRAMQNPHVFELELKQSKWCLHV